MHIIKWVRKNERKIMAWVVILIMISFVGGYGLQQFLMYIGHGGARQVTATYADGKKILASDFQNAQNELEILRMLMADRMLGALSQVYGDLGPALLQTILFPDARISGEFRTQLVQLSERGQLHLNVEQIDQFFSQHQHRPEFLWYLLKVEAKEAGYSVTETEAANYLRQIVSAMTQNQMEASFFINEVMQRTKKSEDQIIRIFGQLVAVMNYSDLVLGNYAVTTDEIRAVIARTMERLSAEYILLDSGPMAQEQPEPTPQQIENQFQQYRSRIQGEYAADNLYGFGYKIPKQIQLEYFLVNQDDVQKRIEKPSAEELEAYYTRNLSKYQRSEPIDPNNPKGETRTITRSFAQVANQIRQEMEKQKAEDRAILILNEARQMTESGLTRSKWKRLRPIAPVGRRRLCGGCQGIEAEISDLHLHRQNRLAEALRPANGSVFAAYFDPHFCRLVRSTGGCAAGSAGRWQALLAARIARHPNLGRYQPAVRRIAVQGQPIYSAAGDGPSHRNSRPVYPRNGQFFRQKSGRSSL